MAPFFATTHLTLFISIATYNTLPVFKTQRWLLTVLTVAHPVGAANLALAQPSAALERDNVGMREDRGSHGTTTDTPIGVMMAIAAP